MQKVKILIVEDEWIVSEEIKELLIKNKYDVIGQAEDAESALAIVHESPADIALLDINIKGDKDGIELAQELNQTNTCAIIFLTAFDDKYFLDRAKKVKPAAYIVKPFEERNLKVAIEMAFNNLSETAVEEGHDNPYFVGDQIFIKDNSRFRKILLNDILYVEAVGSYTDIHFTTGKTTLAINLKAFEGKLSDPKFMRVHRSFLINTDKVDEYEGNSIYISQKSIPLSASRKEEFLKRFKFI
jgi:DNA-binding LytR/AlgR family response regulator